jgi:hypothetical protein
MTKLNLEHQSLTLFATPRSDTESARRLMVLVPCLEVDLTAVTRRVWELADGTGAHIKFLGLCNDAVQEPSLRRALVTMSAMVNYDNVSAETEVIVGRDWLGAVKSRCHPGDMIVCIEEQRTGLLRKPLSQILQSDLDVPLYILSGLYPQNDSRSNWPARPAAWIGFIAILLGFFVLQIKIVHLANAWTIVLELLSTVVEFCLIWVWNSLFG